MGDIWYAQSYTTCQLSPVISACFMPPHAPHYLKQYQRHEAGLVST
jgi:hypothetical protein